MWPKPSSQPECLPGLLRFEAGAVRTRWSRHPSGQDAAHASCSWPHPLTSQTCRSVLLSQVPPPTSRRLQGPAQLSDTDQPANVSRSYTVPREGEKKIHEQTHAPPCFSTATPKGVLCSLCPEQSHWLLELPQLGAPESGLSRCAEMPSLGPRLAQPRISWKPQPGIPRVVFQMSG